MIKFEKYTKNITNINSIIPQPLSRRGYGSKETIAVQTCGLFTASWN
jgi:hypothetical protein